MAKSIVPVAYDQVLPLRNIILGSEDQGCGIIV